MLPTQLNNPTGLLLIQLGRWVKNPTPGRQYHTLIYSTRNPSRRYPIQSESRVI